MTGLAIQYQLTDIKQLRQRFDPKKVDKALQQALQKTAMKTRTEISKETHKKYNIKAGDISRSVRIKKILGAVSGRWLVYTGETIGLEKFGASKKNVKTPAGRRVGASVRIRKDRGRRLVQGGFFANAQGEKIFKRKGAQRLPIQRLFGPSIPHMVGNQMIMDDISRLIGHEMIVQFDRAFRHQLERL